ncbi:PREDICTED: ZZ-type zinc finger-containing protein 3-like [Priapulus caudatus]|uniref:ZZ-type zinc finger-containing protein 3-like n=1 Tax=Priapulus caudatus TaxID=37621 RepID=A0ABM1E2V0_PRICU|nr:PREDICTED: ZZ-type zinc finger-containing protein 3-like [Priapulus caudatus]
MLRAIVLLEAQRIQAIKDHETLVQRRDEALEDPVGFVARLQRREELHLPRRQRVTELPHIAWEKYSSPLSDGFNVRYHMTRRGRQPESTASTPVDESTTKQDGSLQGIEDERDAMGHVVRGRVMKDNKPQTFNQLWTTEEQRRLEELLITYPPEEVEARRWQKIAKALGNRTSQQVASRVQKYFIKLARAGLPIPGRTPNLACHVVKRFGMGARSARSAYPYCNSTFLASYSAPVFMPDEDDLSSMGDSVEAWGSRGDSDDNADEDPPPPEDIDGIAADQKETEEYKELLRLKSLRQERLQQCRDNLVQHIGYRCDSCSSEPITGTRWHCMDCPPDVSTDLCRECYTGDVELDIHRSSHRMAPVKKCTSMQDGDYTGFTHASYNYLDPNYMPAT